MHRLKWLRCAPPDWGYFRSSCGRFHITVSSTHDGYLGLHDLHTGAEHVCRSLDSAKAGARAILSQERIAK